MPADSDLANPASRFVADPLGPLSSFRCNEYGHLCDGAPPPRTRAASFEPGACVPAPEGKLTGVPRLVQQITSVKAALQGEPNKLLVSVIAGFPAPYAVDLVPPTMRDDPCMWPAVHPSCEAPGMEAGAPGVRLAAFTEAFGRNGVYQSVCADSYAAALQRVAEEGGTSVSRCVDGLIPFVGEVAQCTAVVRSIDGAGRAAITPLPACGAAPSTAACWRFGDGAGICGGGRRLEIDGYATLPGGALIELTCGACPPAAATAVCR